MFVRPTTTSSFLRRCLTTTPRPLASPLSLKTLPRTYRHYGSLSTATPDSLAHTRNIGIIAHIDAGKTTTTERMLYYSGYTRRIGEVDEGSTVMDYLPAERARGITIQSAAITFNWTAPDHPVHTVNLIDTPGHADFTFEVERSIRVLDGAVTILDGVAGVEAQTEKVWRQAAKHDIPRIIFVNKLDRVGANFGATVREVATRLNAWPAVLQLPVYENDGRGGEDVLRGVVDVVEKRVFLYKAGDGQDIDVKDYTWLETTNPALHQQALDAREALVELLSNHDDTIVESYLELGDPALIPGASLKRAIRALTLTGTGHIIPVLCGASFRNIGVQPLLDAVIDYLPSPLDRPATAITHGPPTDRKETTLTPSLTNRTIALAFKVINDSKRGAMVFVRVYGGTLTKSTPLLNTTLNIREKAGSIQQMYADRTEKIDTLECGHIGVILGLKHTRTGDTLISETPSSSSPGARKPSKKATIEHVIPATLQLPTIPIPPPVFFASLEPYSLSDQKPLEAALALLLREDPSLQLTVDADSGQTLLSGMGSLHLEIARDRLVTELKARAEMGRILIAYRETISDAATGSDPDAFFTAAITPGAASEAAHRFDANTAEITAEPLKDEEAQTSFLGAAKSGIAAALSRGPYKGLPVHDVHVTLTGSPAEEPAVVATAARKAVTAALAAADRHAVVEPVMKVIVTCVESDLGKVVGDLGRRGGIVGGLGHREEVGLVKIEDVWVPTHTGSGVGTADVEGGRGRREVDVVMPLRVCVDYLKALRSLTGGRASFIMEVSGWDRVPGGKEGEVVL